MAAFRMNKQYKERRHSIGFVLFLVPILVLVISAAIALGWYKHNLQPVSGSEEEVIVTVLVGATVPDVGAMLQREGLIRSPFAFDLYMRLNNYRGRLQAGGYKFTPSQSVQEIADELINGQVLSDLFTILPAQRIDQVRATLIAAGYTVEEVDKAMKADNYASHPALAGKPPGASLEGYLYPESFRITKDTPVKQIIEASLDEMAEALTPALLEKFQAQGLTVHQAIIVASIVENEVPAASGDRSTVAQVYLKRLRDSIPLQADPTARYGTVIATGSKTGWRTYDTPYNTYLYPGLPPGPISNVSTSSLEAVANPSNTDYLYFVADDGDDNVTHFSRTLAEHEAATRKYCQVKCSSY
jgi:UPF0755 protein